MANTLVRIPITGNFIDIETTIIPLKAGEIAVLSLETTETGKLTIGTSGDNLLVSFQKGPHDSPVIDDPPAG